jgi:membrane-bound acyltransferase YfiQ involved in biofilm formation
MSSGFLISALAIISGLTSLTVEAIKKILGDKKYSSNLLAAIVAVILTVAVSAGYLVYFSVPLTPQIVVIIIALVFLAFLASTVGYDKVVQLFKQIGD